MSLLGICPICKREFAKHRSNHMYCSKKCSEMAKELRRKTTYTTPSLGTEVECAYLPCKKTFRKRYGSQKYCCAKCRELALKRNTKTSRTTEQQTKSKKHIPLTLEEISKKMNDMGYGNHYGQFVLDHPELCIKER